MGINWDPDWGCLRVPKSISWAGGGPQEKNGKCKKLILIAPKKFPPDTPKSSPSCIRRFHNCLGDALPGNSHLTWESQKPYFYRIQKKPSRISARNGDRLGTCPDIPNSRPNKCRTIWEMQKVDICRLQEIQPGEFPGRGGRPGNDSPAPMHRNLGFLMGPAQENSWEVAIIQNIGVGRTQEIQSSNHPCPGKAEALPIPSPQSPDPGPHHLPPEFPSRIPDSHCNGKTQSMPL